MPTDLGPALLAIARQGIESSLGISCSPPEIPAEAHAPGAAFVTLTRATQLRGCIGSLEAWRPLHEDVRHNAIAAAFRDPRFPPMAREEWAEVRIEVSVLGAPVLLLVTDEADLLSQLRPEHDGLILELGPRRATFLPQVWESLPQPAQFLAHLKQKAGLPVNFWSPELRFYRYKVDAWKEIR